jgi:glycosyltransferase involved in cell wall biosynthesis
VLATNRHGPFLAATIRSVVAQTWTAWELVVVDDGSPDPDTIEALVADVPNATVIHQNNAGVSVARNIGIALSRGKYLVFLDDDDAWQPERLALQVAALEAEPEAVAAYCQMDFMDEHDRIMGVGNLEQGDLGSFLRHDNGAPIPTLMVTRRGLDRTGVFHPMLIFGEDLDLVFRLARIGRFVFVPDVLVHYRRHGDNATNDARSAALASVRVLAIQQWWSAARGETELVEDIRLGMQRSRRYWTGVIVRESAHELRLGHVSTAGRYAGFVARHNPVEGARALAEVVARKPH